MTTKRLGNKLFLGVALCGCLAMITTLNMMFTNTSQLPEYDLLHLQNIISEMKDQLNVGIRQNEKLQKIALTKLNLVNEPSKVEEEMKRRILRDTKELYYTLQAKLLGLSEVQSKSTLYPVLTSLTTQLSAMMIDAEKLVNLNQAWRKTESLVLQSLIQQRIRHLQNPKDCANARQLVCKLNKQCGFGCQVHHLVYCFMIAYGTQRTLIIESKGWKYGGGSWEDTFLPVSETCQKATGPAIKWTGEIETETAQVVTLPNVETLRRRPLYFPLGIPEELAPRLLRVHGNPSVWWVGQFMSYVMRLQPSFQADLDAIKKRMGFQHPIVGIHVRRTDKLLIEAAFHSIEEYMRHVIFWYDKYDLRLSMEKPGTKATRRVYVASDDPSALPNLQKKYPDYIFLGDTSIAKSAGTSNRYSQSGLRGVITDVYLLSKCDFLSCTFSSQVCRVAYELMQTLHPDASSYFHSLDDIYYYGGQSGHDQVAVMDHDAPPGSQEIDMKVGDVIGIAGNHWNGYSKGTNKRTGKVGLYPSYKVKETIKLINYPTYSEAKEK